ncbi:BglG family transcription antiterminator, partial [Liquorilactobacillus vini]
MLNLFRIKHSEELLKLLIEGQYISVNEFENELNLSRRSVFYLIKKINQALENQDIDPIQNFSKVGYFLTSTAKKKLLEIFKNSAFNNNLDKVQRSNLICWLLINNSQFSTVALAKRLNVSKNTVLDDINLARRLLSTKGLQISQTSKGKSISGSELTKRLWVLEQLSNPNSAIYSQLNIKAEEALEITYQIHSLEKTTKNYFTDDAVSILSYFLVWLLKRLQNKNNQLPYNSNLSHKEFNSLKWSNELLKKYNIDNYNESYFISNVVNTSQFFKINFENSVVKNILPISYKIIEKFNLISSSQINSYRFAHALTTHLVSTFYRAKFKVPFHNKNLHKIVSSYSELFSFTKYAITPFENFIHESLTNDEVSLIA